MALNGSQSEQEQRFVLKLPQEKTDGTIAHFYWCDVFLITQDWLHNVQLSMAMQTWPAGRVSIFPEFSRPSCDAIHVTKPRLKPLPRKRLVFGEEIHANGGKWKTHNRLQDSINHSKSKKHISRQVYSTKTDRVRDSPVARCVLCLIGYRDQWSL